MNNKTGKAENLCAGRVRLLGRVDWPKFRGAWREQRPVLMHRRHPQKLELREKHHGQHGSSRDMITKQASHLHRTERSVLLKPQAVYIPMP
jgi:hypothetical protein